MPPPLLGPPFCTTLKSLQMIASAHNARAACRMRLRMPVDAIADCDAALRMDANCVHACHIRDVCRVAAERAAAAISQPSPPLVPAEIAVSITEPATSAVLPLEGVTPRYLRLFIEQCGGRAALAGLSCSDVKRRFLLPLTQLRQTSPCYPRRLLLSLRCQRHQSRIRDVKRFHLTFV